ncbi:MAG: penicillin-binding protein 2 [Spirochaeta sp.]|jgi:penicillin-binding protein 2|nr:penicillin-binding protein 2 [Spirochaeta sp.]
MSPVQRETVISKGRVIALAIVLGVVFLGYISHLFEMQVLDGYLYLNRAQQNASRSEPIFARRGRIFDRSGQTVLAANRTSFAVTIAPTEVPPGELDRTLIRVGELLDRDVNEMRTRMNRRGGNTLQGIEIVSGLNLEELNAIAERIQALPGVSWYTKPERSYPYGELMSHVLGYVGEITPQELQVLFNEGYTAASVLGKSGIEQQYDTLLRGNDGRRFRTVDARGRRVGENEELIPPEEGMNLVLTLDADLQELAQESLGPRVGSVVVMRPSNGEILAMVSYPRYDPNEFLGIAGQEAFRSLALDRRSPFLNRAIQSVAAPASTFKILMTTAIFEEDAFPPEQEINCTGTFPYGNRVFNDWLEYGHGPVDLTAALAQSCNVYYWTMGSQHLSVDQIIDYSARLGLGRRTGVDLPGEVAGLVPSPVWKEQTYNTRWVGGDTVNMSIGEGFLQVSPIQQAGLVAAIVNDGVVFRPHLLKEIRDPVTGVVVDRTEPEIVREADISRETLAEVRSAMRAVITEGTANVVITTDAVESAGKTGTGEVGSETNWTSWFVAYAPYGEDVPAEEQIVVVVMIDASNEWDWWAPKAANIILHGYFKGLSFDEAVADLRQGPRPLWYL